MRCNWAAVAVPKQSNTHAHMPTHAHRETHTDTHRQPQHLMPRKHPPFPVLCSLATHEHARVKENMARGSMSFPLTSHLPPRLQLPNIVRGSFHLQLGSCRAHALVNNIIFITSYLPLCLIIFCPTSLPIIIIFFIIITLRQLPFRPHGNTKKARSLRAGRAGALSQSRSSSLSLSLFAERVFTFALIMLSWPCLLIELPCARLPSCWHRPPFLPHSSCRRIC